MKKYCLWIFGSFLLISASGLAQVRLYNPTTLDKVKIQGAKIFLPGSADLSKHDSCKIEIYSECSWYAVTLRPLTVAVDLVCLDGTTRLYKSKTSFSPSLNPFASVNDNLSRLYGKCSDREARAYVVEAAAAEKLKAAGLTHVVSFIVRPLQDNGGAHPVTTYSKPNFQNYIWPDKAETTAK